MTASIDVLTIGETMVMVAPRAGRRIEIGGDVGLSIGGAESNVAILAARLGLRAAWVSRLGADTLGVLVLDEIARHGVDVGAVEFDPTAPTGLYVKDPSPVGTQVHYYRAGSAASRISPTMIAEPRLPDARITHFTGILPALSETCAAAARSLISRQAARSGLLSFDVNYRARLWADVGSAATTLHDMARSSDIVFVGLDEAALLWGTTDPASVRRLLPDVPHLIVKDGAVEAVEFEADISTRSPAGYVEVVEPVGAGDAFAAAWLAGYLRGIPPAQRLELGHASAARVLVSPFDLADDVEDLRVQLERRPIAGQAHPMRREGAS